jgi:hypothetical protein
MQDFVGIGVTDSTDHARIGESSLESTVFGSDCVAKGVETTREDFNSAWIDGIQAVLASENIQGCAVLRPGFGKYERAAGKIECGQAVAARQLCLWRPPVQPARNHQVQDEPKIAFHSNGDSLADSPQFAHNSAFDLRKGRLGGAKQKGAGESNSFERLRKDASFECSDVGGDIRQLGHACQLAGRACIFASSLFAMKKNCLWPH